jgi:peptide/nickel transport system permease protein
MAARSSGGRTRTRLAAFGKAVADNKALSLGLALFGLIVFVAIFGRALAPYGPLDTGVAERFLPPQSAYPLGTDGLGRDVLSRVLAGTRTSLDVGPSAAAIATVLGLTVGAVAGYRGGLLDAVLMRAAEVVMIIPHFFLAIVLVFLLGASNLNLIVVIGLLGWPIVARVVRAEVIGLKHRGYVDAARTIGVRPLATLVREILPNALAAITIVAAAQVGNAILLEAGLGYLGLGDANGVSLGQMLQESQSWMRLAWWTAVMPGAVLLLEVVSVNLIAEGINRRSEARVVVPRGWRVGAARRRMPRRGRGPAIPVEAGERDAVA